MQTEGIVNAEAHPMNPVHVSHNVYIYTVQVILYIYIYEVNGMSVYSIPIIQ